MNLLFKLIPGSITYEVSTPESSKKAVQLMSGFPDCVFDVKVKDEQSFAFSCLAASDKRILKSGILSDCVILRHYSKGFFRIISKHQKRLGLLAGAILFVLVLFVQSTVVWDIQVSGNNSIENEEIIGLLDKMGFSTGKKADRDRLSEIENKCILADDRLSWISINMSGTVAFVEIKERSIKSDLSETPSMTGIVASKDCVIELCKVTSGTSLVTTGQTVVGGDMLISPVALGKDGNEYLVGAYGSILARTIEDFYVEINYKSTACSFTGEKSYVSEYAFLGKKMKFKYPFLKNINKFISFNTREKIELSKDVTLPVIKSTNEKYEYIPTEEIMTEEAARNKAYSKMYSKISDELCDAEILTTHFSELAGDNSFVLRCRVECIRDVAKSAEA